MSLELCNKIIALEVAAMLHDTDAEFANNDSARKAKSRCKYRLLFKKSTAVCYFGTKYQRYR